jgi:hypothetical protein
VRDPDAAEHSNFGNHRAGTGSLHREHIDPGAPWWAKGYTDHEYFSRVHPLRARAYDSACGYDKKQRIRFGNTFVRFSFRSEKVFSLVEHRVLELDAVAILARTDPERSLQDDRFFATWVGVPHRSRALFHPDQEGQALS